MSRGDSDLPEYGKSKHKRDDLPQVSIGVAVPGKGTCKFVTDFHDLLWAGRGQDSSPPLGGYICPFENSMFTALI